MISEDKTRPLLILGNRLLAVDLLDLVEASGKYHVAGFVENLEPERCRETIEGYPVIWVDDIAPMAKDHDVICGISTTLRHRFVAQVSVHGFRFATLIHPAACISPRSSIGAGCIIEPGVVIASHTTVCKHVFLNRGVLVGHDTRIDSYASLQPGANVAGVCHISESTYVGMGSVVIDHTVVGRNSVIAAGAVVTKNIPDNVMVAGVPAQIKKTNINGK